MNSNVKEMLNKVYSEDKATELSKVLDNDKKNGIVCGSLREYMLNAVSASERLQENAAWCNAYLIAAIVSSPDFEKAFKDRTDLADALGYSKGQISKCLGVVELRDVLFEKGYVGTYTVGQLSELLPMYREQRKKELDILPVVDFMKFNEHMTSKEVREGIKAYKNSFLVEKKTPTTASVASGTVNVVETPTTASVASGTVNVVETPTTTSVASGKVEVHEEKPHKLSDKAKSVVELAVKGVEEISITFKNKDGKVTNGKVMADKYYDFFEFCLLTGIISDKPQEKKSRKRK